MLTRSPAERASRTSIRAHRSRVISHVSVTSTPRAASRSKVGIIEDADDTITEATFFEFIRRSVVEDLPASKIPMITNGFHRVSRPLHAHDHHHVGDIHAGELAAAPAASTPKGASLPAKQQTPETGGQAEEETVVDKEEALQLLQTLGFHLDDLTFTEVAPSRASTQNQCTLSCTPYPPPLSRHRAAGV